MLPNNTIVEMRQFFESQHLASRQAFEVSQAIRRDRLLRLQRLGLDLLVPSQLPLGGANQMLDVHFGFAESQQSCDAVVGMR